MCYNYLKTPHSELSAYIMQNNVTSRLVVNRMIQEGMDNDMLNCYYEGNVKMKRDETSRNVGKILPIVDEILRYVHSRDKRFLIKPLNVGSYYSHLKVGRADEFDYCVVLDIGKLVWVQGKTRYYGFDDRGNKVVEKKGIALPSPPIGQCFTEIGSIRQEWDRQCLNDGVASMTIDDDIVPIKVKRRFKALVGEAINQPKFRNCVSAERLSSSPATTLYITLPGIGYDICVDLCPMIEGRLEFKPEFRWPRSTCMWPSQDKIQRIKAIGINEVAKTPFYWTLSFAACEKELLEGIDVGGTYRKKSERIMKRLKDDVWCPSGMKKKELTSYHLKNVLFWECEDHPYDTEWMPENLSTRIQSMTYRLLGYIQRRNLPLYFHTGVNLLATKDQEVLQVVADNIVTFLNNPVHYLRE